MDNPWIAADLAIDNAYFKGTTTICAGCLDADVLVKHCCDAQ